RPPRPDRRPGQARLVRQHLPLHGLPEHRRRRPPRRRRRHRHRHRHWARGIAARMFPADFAYARARSLDDAFDLFDEAAAAGEEAKLIAGGQSLLPMMKLRLATPQVLIDLADVAALKRGQWTGSGHTIGALTPYRQLGRGRYVYRAGTPAPVNGAARLVDQIPALGDALAVLADPQVRARGTIGGAVAHGDPAADLPAVLLALDAELAIASRRGE